MAHSLHSQEWASDREIHDAARPDFSKIKVVGLTREMAESYAPMNITASYAGQDGTAKPPT
jgi:hypothetical protein